ncbi:MAG TPA: signal peptidase I [Cerasibacillus sp.]|uniref:signal peptidase I n=1 Tax=Cerasibacillus sp. TaxID=2498711 RepID=UPI002F420038
MSKKKFKEEFIGWFKAFLIAVLIALFLRSFVFATSIVDGDSMFPALENGERVIFNKAVYIIGEPAREDIVIIQRPLKNYVKRIVGLPGETIEVKDHILYINEKAYQQSFLSEDMQKRTGNFGPIEIPEESYFVLGDNRARSKDSRNGLGFINKQEIIGRSEFIIYPFSEWSFTR